MTNMLQNIRRCIRYKRPSTITGTLVILFTLVVIFTINTPITITQWKIRMYGTEIACFRYHNMKTLPDINDENPPKNSIFFHETSCKSSQSGRIMLNPRQACAVESAALLHPDRQVYILFTSPGELKPGVGDGSDLAINSLLTYTNIKLGHLDFARYVNNTPIEHIYSSGALELSQYAGSHASDVLRYLTLWKHGGVYLDLDVVITKKLDDLGDNYAGSESDENVAAGVLGFSAEGDGHKWARDCLNDLSTGFSGSDWGRNGPGVITRLLRNICGVQKAIDMNKRSCHGFKVMPPSAFYPIPWWNWTMYFDKKFSDTTMEIVQESYAIHVWNKHSYKRKLVPEAAYARVASVHCPKVYNALKGLSF